MSEIGRPEGNFPMQDGQTLGQLSRDTNIHHDDSRTKLAAQYVDRRATAREVLHHLRGDCRRIRRDALGRYAVIGGHDDNRPVHQSRPSQAGDAG
jgi:hypothetical protein